MTEQEMRRLRVCFTGHRPNKLADCSVVKNLLTTAVYNAVAEGFVTFITGMAWGVDILAGQAVLEVKKAYPHIHLIAAMPFPDFGRSWPDGWAEACADLLKKADLVKFVSPTYTGKGVFQVRNEWMVNHSSRLIAYYDGTPGGTRNTVNYAKQAGIEIINCKEV